MSVPKTLSETESRQRRYFQNETDALKFAASLRSRWSRGVRGGLLKVAEALDAESALEILKPTGMSLTEAAKAIVSQFEAAGTNETFRERYAAALLDGEGRWSDTYRAYMERIPNWAGEIMDTRCALLTPEKIRSILIENGSRAESTITQRKRYISSVLNFKPRHRKTKTIAIMTDAQCGAMLRATEQPSERWAVALLLFAGIRPSSEDGEISRLDWSSVGKKEIYISEDVAKTPSDRHIPITPRLRRLLRGHPKEGLVIPAGWRKIYQRVRKAAGISGEHDITRHTFASHCLAAYGEKATKDAMGHTEGSTTLFRHYRRAVREDDGKAYFSDLPSADKIRLAKERMDTH